MSPWVCDGVAGLECTMYSKCLSTFRNLICNDQSVSHCHYVPFTMPGTGNTRMNKIGSWPS